jgi:hypothetical protein
MGRAGFEPAALGLKVDAAEFERSRENCEDGTVERNQRA